MGLGMFFDLLQGSKGPKLANRSVYVDREADPKSGQKRFLMPRTSASARLPTHRWRSWIMAQDCLSSSTCPSSSIQPAPSATVSGVRAVTVLVVASIALGCAGTGIESPLSTEQRQRPDLLTRPDVRLSAPGDRFGDIQVADLLSLRAQSVHTPNTGRPFFVNHNWEFVGPGNYGGKVMDLDIHPTDPSIWWAAYGSGAVWKTSNAGANWSRVYGVEQYNYVSSVAIWEADPQVVYIGLGTPGKNFELERGLLRTADGGETWEMIGPFDNRAFGIYRILPHPIDPATIVIASEAGIFRTTDSGANWSRALEYEGDNWWTYLPDLIRDRSDPNLMWAAQENLGIAKSVDGGATWSASDTGISDGEGIILAQCPTTGTLYAMRPVDPWPTIELYRSVDGGTTWTLRSHALSYFHQGRYDLSMVVDPADPDHIIVGNVALLESWDGGQTFSNRYWTAGINSGPTPHADHLRLKFAPSSPTVLLSGNDGGVWRSVNRGGSWDKVDIGVQTNLAHHMAVTNNGDRIYLTSGDWGSGQIYENGVWRDYFGYEWQFYYAEPGDPDIVYTSNGGTRLARVQYDGAYGSAQNVDPCPGGRSPYARPMLFDPDDPATIYASCGMIYRSTNRGDNWETISPEWDEVYIMAIAPTDRQKLMAWTAQGMKRSSDGGATWTHFNDVPAYPQTIRFDPHDPSVFYVGAVWDFWKYTEGGSQRTSVRGNLPDSPVRQLVVDPRDGTLIISNDIGIFLSKDDGDTWFRIGHGLPAVGYAYITLVGDVIFAAGGQGVWKYDLAANAKCVPTATTACLLDDSFQVTGTMETFDENPQVFPLTVMSFPTPRAESQQAAFFESFESGNFEAGVKMVDGCALPDGHPLRAYWLFAGGLTNSSTDLRIQDTVTGVETSWTNPAGNLPTTLGITDAFPCVEGQPSCERDTNTACLLDRFAVTGVMEDFDDPPQSFPTRVMEFPELRAESDQAAFFESFDEGNFEVGVKMVDACMLPEGHSLRAYWVFFGGLTNAKTDVSVIQASTGNTLSLSVTRGQFPTSTADVNAFPCE